MLQTVKCAIGFYHHAGGSDLRAEAPLSVWVECEGGWCRAFLVDAVFGPDCNINTLDSLLAAAAGFVRGHIEDRATALEAIKVFGDLSLLFITDPSQTKGRPLGETIIQTPMAKVHRPAPPTL
jgi:hypothetical protein